MIKDDGHVGCMALSIHRGRAKMFWSSNDVYDMARLKLSWHMASDLTIQEKKI